MAAAVTELLDRAARLLYLLPVEQVAVAVQRAAVVVAAHLWVRAALVEPLAL
jgi:hypothetical protein